MPGRMKTVDLKFHIDPNPKNANSSLKWMALDCINTVEPSGFYSTLSYHIICIQKYILAQFVWKISSMSTFIAYLYGKRQ